MNNTRVIKYLVLWVASHCNLSCKYCYADGNFNGKLMDFEVAKRAIELTNTKEFTLIFAGGEPLLNFPLIEKVYEFLKENGYTCKLGMQSNGTLISPYIARRLKEMDVNIGLSFDASFEVNDYFRGSSKKIIQGIRQLKEVGKNINLNTVLTDRSIKELEKLIDICYYFENVEGVGLDLLRLVENKDVRVADPKDIYPYVKKAYLRCKQLEKLTGKKVAIREIEEIRYRKSCSCKSSAYCYSSLGQAMVVCEQGDIYPCSSLVGDEKYLSGNIFNPEDIEIVPLSDGKLEECRTCKYNSYCKGACPARIIYNEKYNKNQDCILRKAIFRILEEEENER